jgi:hypothetical protein
MGKKGRKRKKKAEEPPSGNEEYANHLRHKESRASFKQYKSKLKPLL